MAKPREPISTTARKQIHCDNRQIADFASKRSEPRSAEQARARILRAVRSIPEGFVTTYGDLSPKAPRLAGQILSSGDADDLPWWRVVRADGSLAVGEKQKRLLEAEGVPFLEGSKPRVDLSIVWFPSNAGLGCCAV